MIRQTYRQKSLGKFGQKCRASWIDLNQEFTLAPVFDDQDVTTFFKTEHIFSEDSKIADVRRFVAALPLGVMKADVWRYAILATRGGLYADMDSSCSVPIDQWPQSDVYSGVLFNPSTPWLVVGVENAAHFCQWVCLYP